MPAKTVVRLLQPLGHDLLVDFADAEGAWAAVAQIDWKTNWMQPGDRVKACLELASLHFFDAHSGERLRLEETALASSVLGQGARL